MNTCHIVMESRTEKVSFIRDKIWLDKTYYELGEVILCSTFADVTAHWRPPPPTRGWR